MNKMNLKSNTTDSPDIQYFGNDVALVDIDGTLADYDGQMIKSLESICHPSELPLAIGYGIKQPDHIWSRMQLIKSKGDWWENLPRLKLGFDILEVLRELNFYISILTQGPKSNPIAWSHKVSWCIKNVPDLDVTITRNKGLVYGKVLVDDYPEYVGAWLNHRPRGLVVMPAQRWNEDFTHPQVIRYDGSNLGKIREALEKVKNRKRGENWQ